VPCRWQQLLQHGQVPRRLIVDDLGGRDARRASAWSKNRRAASAGRDEHVDDLTELVD
jgi:hypothetical protein